MPTHFPSIPGSAFPKPIISRRLSRYDAAGYEGGIKSLLVAISVGDLQSLETIIEEIKDTVTLLNKDMFYAVSAAIKTGDPLIVQRIMREVKARRYFPVRYLTTILTEAIRSTNIEIIKQVKIIRPKMMIPENDVVQLVFEAVNTSNPVIVSEIVKSGHFKKKLSNENAFQILTKALSSHSHDIISSVITNFKPKKDLSAEHKLTLLRVAIAIPHMQTVEFCLKLRSFLTPEDMKDILLSAAKSTADVFEFVHNAVHPMLCNVPIETLLQTAMREHKSDIVDKIIRKYKFFDYTLLDLLLKHLREPDPHENIVISMLEQVYFLPEGVASKTLASIIVHDFETALSSFHWNSFRSNLSSIVCSAIVDAAKQEQNRPVSEASSENGNDDVKSTRSRDHSEIVRSVIFKCRTLETSIVIQVLKSFSVCNNVKCLELFLKSLTDLSEEDAREVLRFIAQSVETVDVVETLLRHCTSVTLDDLDICIKRCHNDKVRELLVSHRRRIVTKQFREQYGDILKEVFFGYNSKREIILVAIFRKTPPLLMSDFMSYSVSNKVQHAQHETEL